MRASLERLLKAVRQGRGASRSIDIVDPHNVAVSINTDRPGSATTVNARQTVVSREGATRTVSTRSSRSRSGSADQRGDPWRDPTKTLTEEELAAEEASELADREAMSLVDANVAVPVNAGVAANVLSDESTATANAEQTNDFEQENE